MNNILHTFEDGWVIKAIDSTEELEAEDKAVHSGYSCLGYDSELWLERLENKDYALASLQNTEGERRATLLWGEKEWAEENSDEGYDYDNYYALYADCRVFEPVARKFNGQNLYFLQCCPPGYTAGDISGKSPEYHRIKEWWENLPLA